MVEHYDTSNDALKADARNRAVRTLLNGLGFTVLTAIVLVLMPVFSDAKGWDDIDLGTLGFALFQAVGMAALSYIMRSVLDPSGIPTPLPPSNPGEPDKSVVVDEPGWDDEDPDYR